MKKVLSLVLMFTVLLGTIGGFSVIAETEEENFSTKSYGYYDSNGDEMVSLGQIGLLEDDARKVTLKAKVENVGTDNGKAAVIAVVYNDGKLFDSSIEERNFKYKGSVQSYEMKLKIPAQSEQTDCSIKTFLWEEISTLKPLSGCTSNLNGNANVKSLYVNGIKIKNFSSENTKTTMSEYTNISIGENPEIVAICEDLGAYAVCEYLDGAIIVTAKAANGNQKIYTVNVPVVSEQPQIISASLNYDKYDGENAQRISDEQYFTIQERKLARPDYELDDNGELAYETVTTDETSSVVLKSKYADIENSANFFLKGDGEKYILISDVPSQLKGATVLQGKRFYNATNNSEYDYSDMTATLTLNHSARLYYPASGAINDGAIVSTDAAKLKVINFGNWSAANTARIPALSTITDSYIPSTVDKFYEIDLVVPEGQIKTFTINVCGNSTSALSWKQYGPSLILKWLDKGNISDSTLSYNNGENVVSYKTLNNGRPLETANYKYAVDSEIGKDTIQPFGDFSSLYAGTNFIYEESGVYQYISSEIPEEMRGATVVTPGRLNIGKDNYDDMVANFKIDKSATVYYRATADVAAQTSGAVRATEADGLKYIGNQYSSPLYKNAPDLSTQSDWIGNGYDNWYKVDLSVDEGTETEFSIPVAGINSPWESTHTGPVLIFKWHDNDVVKSLEITGLSGEYYEDTENEWKPMVYYNSGSWVTDGSQNSLTLSSSTINNRLPNTDDSENIVAYGDTIFNLSTMINANIGDKLDIYETVPDEMIGATPITMHRNDAIYGTETDGTYEAKTIKYTFTLNKTATLYFSGSENIARKYGAEKLDDQMSVRKCGFYKDYTNWIPGDSSTETNINLPKLLDVYKLKCVVPDECESKTFEIEVGYEKYYGTIVCIK